MTPNFEKFQNTLEARYEDLFKTDSEYAYSAKISTPKLLAAKMTLSLSTGSANKDGKGIKQTCKILGIPYTYVAITSFLKN